jgi:hypothetical protein|tara:strand:+ start:492 stop:830 length:339 start_codon:yes stop_codon:yes gene_type:complete
MAVITNPIYGDADRTIIYGDETATTGLSIPTDPLNSDYDALIESGVEIAAYVVPAMTWDEVRADRNRRLADTDFHALADVTMSDEMTAYRQALRDVPDDNADPDDISWPTKP